MDIKIDYLKECPETIPTLAKMWYEVLGSIWISDISIEQEIYNELNHSALPLTLVALKST